MLQDCNIACLGAMLLDCKLINSRGRNPHIYHDGDIVFAQRTTHSNAKGRINKLMHLFTGPWRIVKSLPGTLYKIECIHRPSWRHKKHAADLLLHPPELIPFKLSILLTIVTASSFCRLVNHQTKRPVSKVSHPPPTFLHCTPLPHQGRFL